MFQLDSLAKWLVVFGLGIAAFGVLLFLIGRVPGADRLGNLPGDIRIQLGDNVSCFVPIVTSILLSLILTIVLNVVIRLLNR